MEKLNLREANLNQESVITEGDKKFINDLFETIASICNAYRWSWEDQRAFNQSKKEWLKAFIHVGIRDESSVKLGVKKLRLRKSDPNGKGVAAFIPSIGDFISWCQPNAEDLGIPSAHEAYQEAIANYGPRKENPSWSHEVIRFAALQTTSFELMSRPKEISFAIFERNFYIATKMFGKGKLCNIPKALPETLRKDDKIIMNQYLGVKGPGEALAILRGGKK